MLRVIVLGAAAGGGLPQWNCGCGNCRGSRADDPNLRGSSQTSLAVSADDINWVLINASPDLRQQLLVTPRLHPKPGALRDSPIVGVVLTNAEVDAIAGLLTMREGARFMLYAHSSVLAILANNSIFDVLDASNVSRQHIKPGERFRPTLPDGSELNLEILPFAVPGKVAWYLENYSDAEGNADTLGLQITDLDSGAAMYVVTSCARMLPELKQRLDGASLVFFDGTLWRDDELIALGLSNKTGQRMGHIAMDGDAGAIASLADANIARKVFLHINNSNPALRSGSPERTTVERAGWRIATDGMEFTL